jgi:hypothetical protein
MTTTITQPERSSVRSSTVDPSNSAYSAKDTTAMLSRPIQLINEALSRARMRQPQTMNSEAIRPARRITMHALREHDRMLGL